MIAAAAVAAPASAIESTIYPGVGIGKIKLGMSAAQVMKGLGNGYLVGRRSTVSGVHYVEYQWDFSNWTVTFAQRGHALRAVQVVTSVRNQRTSKGIGPGTPWRKLVQTYPGGQCGWSNPHYSAFDLYLAYLVPHRGGTQTLYLMKSEYSKEKAKTTGYHILAVFIRTPYEPLDGFGVHRDYRCSDGWQNDETPTTAPIH